MATERSQIRNEGNWIDRMKIKWKKYWHLKLLTPEIPELKLKWPKYCGSPNLSFEYTHAWQLESCRFESSLSHQLLYKKFNAKWLFIKFLIWCVMSQKIPSVSSFTINSEGFKRYYVDTSQLFSLDCFSLGSNECGRRLSFLYLIIPYVFSTKISIQDLPSYTTWWLNNAMCPKGQNKPISTYIRNNFNKTKVAVGCGQKLYRHLLLWQISDQKSWKNTRNAIALYLIHQFVPFFFVFLKIS